MVVGELKFVYLGPVDLKKALPQYMTQQFGLAYVAMFPDLPAHTVLNDSVIYNVLSVAYGQTTHPADTHKVDETGIEEFLQPPDMPIEVTIRKTGEKWAARSRSRYMVSQTQDPFPEFQFRRHAKEKLPAKCDTETLAVVDVCLQPKQGEDPLAAP